MSSLTLDGVHAAYSGGPEILRGVDLEVAPGELVALIGPSGSGKSTVLRAVVGLLAPSAGRILVDGDDVAPIPVHRRNMSLMFQDHALFEHLDVADNIAYGLRRHGWSEPDRLARVAELLDLVDLGAFGDRAISSLSGGQAQRVALARALAPRPSVLLLDEPMASLDLVLRRQLADEIAKIVAVEGVTTLLVTHDQTEASSLADRLAVLDDGRVVQEGSPDEIWRRPVNAFVAEFLGHPNLWTTSDGRRVVAPVTALSVAPETGAAFVLEVTRTAFDEGRIRVLGRRLDTGEDAAVFAPTLVAVGQRLGVAVDDTQLVELSS